MNHQVERAALIFVLSAIVIFSACHKAHVASAVPPPPPAPAPTVSLKATPLAIEKGQPTTLTWETTNATEVSLDAEGYTIDLLGMVQSNGSQEVMPLDSTTYTVYAKGPGGTQMASVRVTVTVPVSVAAIQTEPTEDELFDRNVRDVHFDFDKWDIRTDETAVLQTDAAFLVQHPHMKFTVEGNCDDLALGDKRADQVKKTLVSAGISSTNIVTMSYGKEKPVCLVHDETCWQQNRRDHFTR